MNTKFPGRPDYSGPTEGYFALLHHEQLWEHSHDVRERIDYVRARKPAHEIAVRLRNMLYLDPQLVPAVAQIESLADAYHAQRKPLADAYLAQLKPLDDAYHAQIKPLEDAYHAQIKPLDDAVLTYIRTEIPDCAWDGKQLVFESQKGGHHG